MDEKETGIDIYKVSDNALYIIRSDYCTDTIGKIIEHLNTNASLAGLKTRFAWMPDNMKLEQFRRG